MNDRAVPVPTAVVVNAFLGKRTATKGNRPEMTEAKEGCRCKDEKQTPK